MTMSLPVSTRDPTGTPTVTDVCRLQVQEAGHRVAQHLYQAATRFERRTGYNDTSHAALCISMTSVLREQHEHLSRYTTYDVDGKLASWLKIFASMRDSFVHGKVTEGWLSPQLGAQTLRELARDITGTEGHEDAAMARLARASESLKKAPCLNTRQGDGDAEAGPHHKDGGRRSSHGGSHRGGSDGSRRVENNRDREYYYYRGDSNPRFTDRPHAAMHRGYRRDSTGGGNDRDDRGRADRAPTSRPSPQAAAASARPSPSAPNAANSAARGGELA
jgi:hypothetical protein